MHCADCERIDHLLYDRTAFWLGMPTAESRRRVLALARSHGWAVAENDDGRAVCITVLRGEADRLITALYGELQGPERADVRVVTTDGREPGSAELARVLPFATFANRYKSEWLVEALEAGRYETWFQPILAAGGPEGPRPFALEGLFRLQDRDGTVIPPGYVFEIAAESGLLFSLDLVARRSAVEAAVRSGTRAKLFINFNPSSIYDPSYCLRTTAAAIEELGLRPADVVFELTETHRAHDKAHLKGILAFYRAAGFGVALDDVGSGWSSLNLLHELRPDYVKIDMELIRDVHADPFRQSIVHHLLAIAEGQGIRTIAEGVETAEEAAWLVERGVDFLQGYHFGRPAPLPAAR